MTASDAVNARNDVLMSSIAKSRDDVVAAGADKQGKFVSYLS